MDKQNNQKVKPKGQEFKCDLCWNVFTFEEDEKIPTWCPECKIGVLREINLAA